jgi:hypothetical protein
VSGLFRTMRVLQVDTRREQHFRWAAKYSIDANEIDTLKDGVESAINGENCDLELRRWARKFAALRARQTAAVAVAVPAELPEAQRWAMLLPTEAQVGKLKGKAAQAAALAGARRLVFTHALPAPADPSLVISPVPWEAAQVARLLSHPLFGPPADVVAE